VDGEEEQVKRQIANGKLAATIYRQYTPVARDLKRVGQLIWRL